MISSFSADFDFDIITSTEFAKINANRSKTTKLLKASLRASTGAEIPSYSIRIYTFLHIVFGYIFPYQISLTYQTLLQYLRDRDYFF